MSRIVLESPAVLVVTLPLMVAIDYFQFECSGQSFRAKFAKYGTGSACDWGGESYLVALGCNFTSASFRTEILVFRIRIFEFQLSFTVSTWFKVFSSSNDAISTSFTVIWTSNDKSSTSITLFFNFNIAFYFHVFLSANVRHIFLSRCKNIPMEG